MNGKLFASLAVFRELYDKEKDIYDIVSNFILEIIVKKKLYTFNISDIHQHLNDLFDFQLPDGIIKTSIKKLDYITLSNGNYLVEHSKINSSSKITEKEELLENNYEHILKDLQKFVEVKKDVKLNAQELIKLEREFSSFLLGNSNENGYSDLISTFIVENSNDKEFMQKINLIKEGIILYTGLKFTPNINEFGSWKSKITIYLDIEILFHLSGYNGELFKKIFDDFYSLIKEINNKSLLVTLKYFSETKNEIENFFKKAEYIVIGQDKLNPSIIAMNSIVEGCGTKSDVLEKKIYFYELLDKYKIVEDNYDLEYTEDNYQYNVVDRDLEIELLKEFEADSLNYKLKLLNYISQKRGKKSINNFENIGAILLSANSKTLRIAWHNDIKEQGEVPLATNIDFLTNKFWFKLNKGFGINSYPKTFSVVTKAQIVLSSHINDNLNKQFENIQQKFKQNKISEKNALQNLIFIKESIKKPEDVEFDNLNDIFNLLSEDAIEDMVSYHEYLKNEVEVQNKNNEKLEIEISVAKKELEDKDLELEDKNKKIQEFKNLMINEKKQLIHKLEEKELKLNSKIDIKFKNYKNLLLMSFIIYYTILSICYFIYGWDKMEGIIWICTILLPLILSCFYIINNGYKFDLEKFLNEKKERIKIEIYKENDFNPNDIISLENEIENINL